MLNSGPLAAILDWTDGHGNYVHLCWFLHIQLGIQATLFFFLKKRYGHTAVSAIPVPLAL